MESEQSVLKCFRASVNLERFYSDSWSRAFVWIDTRRWATVGALLEHLRELFALPAGCELMVDGHLLPQPEPIHLLQPEDRFEIVPLNVEESQQEVAELGEVKQEVRDNNGLHKSEMDPHSIASDEDKTVANNGGDEARYGEDTLEQRKRIALDLLSKVSGGVSGGRITKRKRVRKHRKPPVPADAVAEAAKAAKAAEAEAEAPTRSPVHTRFPEEEEGESGGKARLVEALPSLRWLLARLASYPVMDSVPYPLPGDLVLFALRPEACQLTEPPEPAEPTVLAKVVRVLKGSGLVTFRLVDGACGERQRGAELELPWRRVLQPRLVI